MHPFSCFVTLTYSDAELPPGGSLVHAHFQKFMRKLRKFFAPVRVSFFMCGEYGDELGRPHFHALLFGVDFLDKTPWKKAPGGAQLFVSPTLQRLWGRGFTSIGAVTFQSAAYCARYVIKKVTGARADSHYRKVDPDTGEIHDLVPEYLQASLRPAIGKRWLLQFGRDVFPDDFVVVEGKRRKVPRYYDKLHQVVDLRAAELVRRARVERAATTEARVQSSPARLAVREEVKRAQVRQLRRSL